MAKRARFHVAQLGQRTIQPPSEHSDAAEQDAKPYPERAEDFMDCARGHQKSCGAADDQEDAKGEKQDHVLQALTDPVAFAERGR